MRNSPLNYGENGTEYDGKMRESTAGVILILLVFVVAYIGVGLFWFTPLWHAWRELLPYYIFFSTLIAVLALLTIWLSMHFGVEW